MKYLIKLWSEITIKSEAVRRSCIWRLKKNINLHLDFHNIDCSFDWDWDRFTVDVFDGEDHFKITDILKNIPGIENFFPVIEYIIPDSILSNQEKIFEYFSFILSEYFSSKIEWKSFVVRAHRVGNHIFWSEDLERYVWEYLLSNTNNTRVSLKEPDITVGIDIRDNIAYILTEKIKGTSWFPVGFQWKLLSLISWWYDSSVATQSLIKRWCEVDYLFFNLWWSAHELGVKQMSYHLWSQFSIPYKRAKFISVPFDDVVNELMIKVPARYRSIILKRLMLKAADSIAQKYYSGIIKWDSVGQVSSQTLLNLKVIDTACECMILRPLIWMNKIDIINISKNIWTYDYASSMPEYCGLISKKPETKAKLEDILEVEKSLSSDLLEVALQQSTLESISDVLFTWFKECDIEEVRDKKDQDIVIDIRDPELIKKSPLSQKWIQGSIEIPFYSINNKFYQLDQSVTYLFYCDKWVLSHLHGLYLRDKWFTNIKVIRP